jgi:hypothetical protein
MRPDVSEVAACMLDDALTGVYRKRGKGASVFMESEDQMLKVVREGIAVEKGPDQFFGLDGKEVEDLSYRQGGVFSYVGICVVE